MKNNVTSQWNFTVSCGKWLEFVFFHGRYFTNTVWRWYFWSYLHKYTRTFWILSFSSTLFNYSPLKLRPSSQFKQPEVKVKKHKKRLRNAELYNNNNAPKCERKLFSHWGQHCHSYHITLSSSKTATVFTLETCWHFLSDSPRWWMEHKQVSYWRFSTQSFSDEVLMTCGLVPIISRSLTSQQERLQIKPACNQYNLCFLLQFYMTARFNCQFVGTAWLIVMRCR